MFQPEEKSEPHWGGVQKEAKDRGPQLLCELEPWWLSFVGNLSELLIPSGDRTQRRRGFDALVKGDWFWRDVFVRCPLPKRGLIDSYLTHVLVVVAIIGLTNAGWFETRPVQRRDPFDNVHIEYYNVSEYLPEIDTGKKAEKAAPAHPQPSTPPAPADPVFAKQEIISVPPNPDNFSQTIVTPQLPKVDRQVDLPNIVSNLPALAPQPIIVPKSAAKQKPTEAAAPKIDAKAPTVKLDVRAQMPKLQLDVATQSAAVADSLAVPALPANEAPKLEAQTIAPPLSARRAARQDSSDNANVGMPSATSNHAAQIIALSTRPADPRGMLEVPKGNRLGSFAVGPTGRVGGSGVPPSSPNGAGQNGVGGGANGDGSLPPGIKVGAAPGPTPASGTVVASPAAGKPPAPDSAVREKFMAALRNPAIAPPRTGVVAPASRDDGVEDRKLADSFFGSKRFYTLTFNAPNLNSATGSWIIHFAELRPSPGQAGELSGPSPLSKADPAYPPQLMHDRVEGTVVLYAVVHADGSISDVRVLNSVHEELDANAVKALMRWRFQPGKKNGRPVDVEMTVRIPFKAKKMMF